MVGAISGAGVIGPTSGRRGDGLVLLRCVQSVGADGCVEVAEVPSVLPFVLQELQL